MDLVREAECGWARKVPYGHAARCTMLVGRIRADHTAKER